MRQYMAKRYERRKAEWVEKLGGKCAQCGGTEGLQFDHVDPTTKKFTVAQRLAGIAEKRLVEEMAKCQLLCSSCHEEKSLKDMGLKSAKGTHGTLSAYRYC